MKRPLKPEETRIWSLVASTVRPLVGRSRKPEPDGPKTTLDAEIPARIPPEYARPLTEGGRRGGADIIEPNRRHRIAREREEIGARLDLHGLDQQRAQLILEDFVVRAWNEGHRAVLVITGKGVQGDGVLRRAAPSWLSERRLSHIVAGISEAARHHGGAGALYVALKRKPRA